MILFRLLSLALSGRRFLREVDDLLIGDDGR